MGNAKCTHLGLAAPALLTLALKQECGQQGGLCRVL